MKERAYFLQSFIVYETTLLLWAQHSAFKHVDPVANLPKFSAKKHQEQLATKKEVAVAAQDYHTLEKKWSKEMLR